MKIAYMSLGCKVNLYETIAVVNQFIDAAFTLVDFHEKADVYLINTCTVTATSDMKSKKMIRQAIKHNPKAVICVMGCFTQLNPEQVIAIEGVDIICGTSNRHLLFPKVMELLNQKNNNLSVNLVQSYQEINEYEDICVNRFHNKTRGFVKIQDGCENFCSYCAIPFSRGKFRSRPKESIINEIQALTNLGMKEIVLTGINTGAYGKDFSNYSFAMLLTDLIDNVKNLGRLRISSIEVTEITEELISIIKNNLKHFCLHLHIPLQGGSDEILKKMNRKYDTLYYREKINYIRKVIPDINITADVLVGFNGESEDLFTKSLQFIDSINYGEIHVFPYSPRPNTKAYIESEKIGFSDQIDNSTKKNRVNQLLELNKIKALDYRTLFVGKTIEVLVESVSGGFAQGHTSNYLVVKFKTKTAKENDLVKVVLLNNDYPVSKGVEEDVF